MIRVFEQYWRMQSNTQATKNRLVFLVFLVFLPRSFPGIPSPVFFSSLPYINFRRPHQCRVRHFSLQLQFLKLALALACG
jgi:hypothetical protein